MTTLDLDAIRADLSRTAQAVISGTADLKGTAVDLISTARALAEEVEQLRRELKSTHAWMGNRR